MNIDKKWWENNPKWKSNIIPSNGSRRSGGKQWIFLLFFLSIIAFILYDNHIELLAHFNAGEYLEMKELAVLIFPVIFIAVQLKRSRQRSRFGETPFVMNPFPAIIGQRFSGHVEINKEVNNLQFVAELLLMQQSAAEIGDNANTRTDMVWKMPLKVHPERAMLGTRLLIEAKLPDDKPPSQPSGTNRNFWRLYVYSNDKAFKQMWDVPIIAANDYV